MKGELKVREYEEYKAVYCTLCRELGRHYGIRMRSALSYDLTYYTMLALDLSGAHPKVRKGRCVVNPAKRCNYICEGEEAYKKGAALTVLMTYHKVKDNIADEKFIKKFGSRLLLPFVSGPAKKAAADYPFLAEAMEKMMEGQAEAEKNPEASLDACCEPTANAISTIFSELGGDNKNNTLILSQLGYFLGRWIYTMDAADDLQDDLKNHSFNPFIKKLGLENLSELPEGDRKRADEECNQALNNNVAMINSAVNLLNLGRYRTIITNVTNLGLAEVQREILFLHIRDKNKKKLKKDKF